MMKLILTSTKHNDSQQFQDMKDFYKYVSEVLNDDIYCFFMNMEKFERAGYEDHMQWFKDQSLESMKEILWLNDYELFIKK